MSTTITETTITPAYLRKKTKDEIIDHVLRLLGENDKLQAHIARYLGGPQVEKSLVQTSHGPFPRHSCVQHWTDAEKAISEAMAVVERAGADVRLTDAVILLQAARERVADYVDSKLDGPAQASAV